MVQFWQLNLHFLPLEEVVLSLLAHRRYHVELPGHRVGFLGRDHAGSTSFMYRVTHTPCRAALGAGNVHPGASLWLCFTMISIALQRDVPQYMAMPWLMTCVIARTISEGKRQT